jgi:hypothetical protein
MVFSWYCPLRSEVGVWRHPCSRTELTIFDEFLATQVKWNTCTKEENILLAETRDNMDSRIKPHLEEWR